MPFERHPHPMIGDVHPLQELPADGDFHLDEVFQFEVWDGLMWRREAGDMKFFAQLCRASRKV
jgi:hypothetical protein